MKIFILRYSSPVVPLIILLFMFYASSLGASELVSNQDESSYNDTNYIIASQFESTAAVKIQNNINIKYTSSHTRQFYIHNNYNPVWTTSNGQLLPIANQFIPILENSYQDGLNPNDYHIRQIKDILDRLNRLVAHSISDDSDNDSVVYNQKYVLNAQLDILLTDAFFLYSSHMAFGRVNNRVVYPNWIIDKRSFNLQELFNQALRSADMRKVLTMVIPQNPEYAKLKQQLAVYQGWAAEHKKWATVADGVKLTQGMQGSRVYMLQQRLMATGELKSINQTKKGIFDHELFQALIKFQQNNGLVADGVAGSTTIAALNIPLVMRLKQIALNMDRLRYLPSDLGQQYIMVNIPDFSLNLVKNGQTVLTMPVIVGKDDGLQSCVLSSQISYLDINPSWYIPNSIAVRDILPKLKQNPNYLNEHHIKTYTAYGVNVQEVNSKNIAWSKIESNIIPYKLRQEPGTDNPLGRIKFIFPNTCGIYLHDTSTPELFKNSRRDLSHGCIRIGKPIELATYLLADKPGWTQEQILNVINSGKSKVVTLNSIVKIYIVYATAWVNESGVLQFRNDIYAIDDVPYSIYNPARN